MLCKPVAFLSNLAVQSMNRSELCSHFLKSKICRCSYSSWHGGICATAYSSVSCPLQKLLGLWNFSCKLTFILQRVIHASYCPLFIRGMCCSLYIFVHWDCFQMWILFACNGNYRRTIFFQCTMRASEDMFGKLEVANYSFWSHWFQLCTIRFIFVPLSHSI